MHQYATLEDTVYFGFAANLTSGAAGDGATPLYDVRLGGAAAGAAPVLSGTPTLLTHANYSDGCYEVSIAATAANGFAANNTYLVFVTLTIDSVTPAAMIGSFRLAPVPSNVTQALGNAVTTATAGVLDVNATRWANTAITATSIPVATAAGAAGGLQIAGLNAATTYASLTVTGSMTLSDGLLVSRSTSNASAITATGNGTGSGIVATSGGGATGDGIQATAASSAGNGLKLTKTGAGVALAAPTTDLVLAKTTNITGFNDIAATAIVSSGAITTSAGAVSSVTTVSNTTQLNGATTVVLTDASSDAVIADAVWNAATASYGGAGSYGLLIETDLDATISSRLASASYTAPSNLTAAQIATGVWQDATAADFTAANSIGQSVMNGVALGTGLTVNAVTGLTASNLDATISSRMATYAQPTGFLAATFPGGTVASTTNITGGTITTTTNLTNLPSIPADWITAAGIAADAVTEIQAGLATSAALATVDTVVDAIKVKTDQMLFSVTNKVDANIKSVNDVTVSGTGSAPNDPWGP